MTGNETFRRFQILLFPVFDYVFRESYERSEQGDIANPVTHYDLVQVLKSGNPVNFRKAMYTHLAPYYKSIIELKR